MKILLADPAPEVIHKIMQAKQDKEHLFASATTAAECWEKIASFAPDLLLLDIMLPHMHGIEILKKIKADEQLSHIGVILLAAEPMVQSYHAAISSGAIYFLNKPFALSTLFSLINRYKAGTLRPDPFLSAEQISLKAAECCYAPQLHSPDKFIKFWGTRGSNAVSGAEYVRYGGNTAALEVRSGDDLVIIDAGTGIRPLGHLLEQKKQQTIHLFLGHTHFDHIGGFPFFKPLYDPDAHISIYTPVGYEKTTHELFTDLLAYSYFPVRLDEIKAHLTFKDLRDGDKWKIGDIELQTHYAYHPGATLCFKIRVGHITFGYITDNELLMGYHGNPKEITPEHPLLQPHLSLVQFLTDCHFVVHEAQYTPSEYQHKVGWGHSSISNAAVIMKMAGVKDWIVTHHDPQHNDEDLFKKIQLHHDILIDCEYECHLRMAFDGWMLPL